MGTCSLFPKGGVSEALLTSPNIFGRFGSLLDAHHLPQLLQLLQQVRHRGLVHLTQNKAKRKFENWPLNRVGLGNNICLQAGFE